jgi:urea carboxylase system permease
MKQHDPATKAQGGAPPQVAESRANATLFARDGAGPGTSPDPAPDNGMEHFGYRESLARSIGAFGSFAAGVSYISILTGTFQLFYFGFGTAGPAYLWSWPMVLLGQLAVALCFMELAAKYPIAGSVYNWSKILGSRLVGWSSGWLMLTASIVTLSAVVLALQLNLPRLWSGFQLIGNGSGTYDFATNAVILGTVLIVFTTVVNALGVRLMAMINSAGVFIELIAACLIAIILAVHIKRGPEVFFSTRGYGAGKGGGYLSAFLVASLASGYVMYGFDTASSLGEETLEPRRTAPRAILRAILASFVIGGAILVFAVMAAPNLQDPTIGTSGGGLQYIVEQVMWGPLGRIFLVCIVVAVTVCSLAVHTAAIRLTFAMARDNALPFGERLARVNSQTQTPIVPAVMIGVIAELILVLNIGQPKIFTVLTSIAVIMIYLAYLLVTVPMLRKRLAGQWPPSDLEAGGYFTLGRWGMFVNIVAVAWGAGMALNLAWPREAVYGAPWYNTWGAFVYIAVIFGAGLWWYAVRGRHHIGTLASHTLAAPEEQVCRECDRDGDGAGPELARHVLVEGHRDQH